MESRTTSSSLSDVAGQLHSYFDDWDGYNIEHSTNEIVTEPLHEWEWDNWQETLEEERLSNNNQSSSSSSLQERIAKRIVDSNVPLLPTGYHVRPYRFVLTTPVVAIIPKTMNDIKKERRINNCSRCGQALGKHVCAMSGNMRSMGCGQGIEDNDSNRQYKKNRIKICTSRNINDGKRKRS